MSDYRLIEVDDPDAGIRRISLNRPEKRNALSNPLRAELFDALRAAAGSLPSVAPNPITARLRSIIYFIKNCR